MFIEEPSSTCVQLLSEEDAMFSCVAIATTVHCKINGSSDIPSDINCTETWTEDGLKKIMTVVVPALKKYNNTLVQCCLYNRISRQVVCSEPAVLIIIEGKSILL